MRFHLFTGSTCAEECANRVESARSVTGFPIIANVSAGTYGVWFDMPEERDPDSYRVWTLERTIKDAVGFGDLHTSREWRTRYSHMM